MRAPLLWRKIRESTYRRPYALGPSGRSCGGLEMYSVRGTKLWNAQVSILRKSITGGNLGGNSVPAINACDSIPRGNDTDRPRQFGTPRLRWAFGNFFRINDHCRLQVNTELPALKVTEADRMLQLFVFEQL